MPGPFRPVEWGRGFSPWRKYQCLCRMRMRHGEAGSSFCIFAGRPCMWGRQVPWKRHGKTRTRRHRFGWRCVGDLRQGHAVSAIMGGGGFPCAGMEALLTTSFRIGAIGTAIILVTIERRKVDGILSLQIVSGSCKQASRIEGTQYI